MQYDNLLAGRGEQDEDASGNDFKSKSKLHVVVPNDLIKLQIIIFAIYTGAKDNGSNSDHGYSGNTAGSTAGLYWTSVVFVDPDYEL